MDFILHSLKRFQAVLETLECECDDYNGYHCPIHDDKRFVTLAIAKHTGQPPFQPADQADHGKRCSCGALAPDGICADCHTDEF